LIVVSDTSPITNLAAIGRLDLLRFLYTELLIPNAVFDEIAVAGAGRPGSTEVAGSDWIHVRPVTDTRLVAALAVELDGGEAEAIALAIEHSADLVLLDERRARKAATRLGLLPVGVLGTLLGAKHAGHIARVGSLLDALRDVAGFWIADDLYAEVLKLAGE
jgi:predicted nucleic acid-binding protein